MKVCAWTLAAASLVAGCGAAVDLGPEFVSGEGLDLPVGSDASTFDPTGPDPETGQDPGLTDNRGDREVETPADLATDQSTSAETDTDAGTDGDGVDGADSGIDPGTDAETVAGPDPGSDAETVAGPDSGINPEAVAGPDSGINPEAVAGPDSGINPEAVAGPDPGPDPGTDAETVAGPDPGTDADADPSTDADTGADISPLPAPLGHLSAGSRHVCAVTDSGGVKCWGLNGSLQAGGPALTNSNVPLDVTGFGDGVVITAVSAGALHTCALTSTGGVKCWGYGCVVPGDGLCSPNSAEPKDVPALASGVTAIAAGALHTCAITSAGGVKCWGYNDSGQIGDGTKYNATTPVDVVGLTSGVAMIGRGLDYSCAIMVGGGLKTWGANETGQLGDGSVIGSSTPVDVLGLSSGVIAVAGWGYDKVSHTCAVLAGGAVNCWGSNSEGEVGDGSVESPVLTPVGVTGIAAGSIGVSSGSEHSCAVFADGSVRCWGDNWAGQLGNGDNVPSNTPAAVSGLTSGALAVSVGGAFSCALTDAGGIKCWGDNTYGQLGNGSDLGSLVPVDVIGF
jgi:alpha-tubulin suppressor-like RCC1 family protein